MKCMATTKLTHSITVKLEKHFQFRCLNEHLFDDNIKATKCQVQCIATTTCATWFHFFISINALNIFNFNHNPSGECTIVKCVIRDAKTNETTTTRK